MLRNITSAFFALLVAAPLGMGVARAEVLLQYFETEWDEIYRRIPEIAEIGYEGLWTPPPAKSPHAGGQFAGGGNVGYSHFDKFDLGDTPQRGSRATRYGTRGSLRNMVDNARRSHLKIYPDVVMNHNGNGPDYRTYPGTVPNDYHGWWDAGQPGGFKRAPRMYLWDHGNGYGGTLHQELVSLIDFQTESDNRFSTGSPKYSSPPVPFIRHPGQPDKYPYGPPVAENTIQFLTRWIAWLGNAMDFDGVRLDAPKHMTAEFFGLPGQAGTFLHDIQYNFDVRRGFTDYTNAATSFEQLYLNYQDRDDALIFSEFFIGGQSEIDYWRTFGGVGNKFRYLDFPRKSQMIGPAFGGGNLAALDSFAGFSPAEGVMFAHSHDENPPGKLDLAYAYILTRIGLPVVFFTGNNIASDEGNSIKSWMKIGYGSALGDYNYQAVPNMIWVNKQFARASEWTRWVEGDFYVFERYDDKNSSGNPNAGEGLLLVGLNDSGSSQTRNNVQTSFDPGTVLKNYSIYSAGNLTVNGSGQVNLTIPAGNNGQGWVFYAPRVPEADGDPLRFFQGANPAPTMNWVVPGGRLATPKSRQVTRLTADTVDINVHYQNPPDGAVDAVMIKWGLGQQMHPTNYFSPGVDNVSGKFQSANVIVSNGPSGVGHFRLTATITNMAEGLHLVQGRAFVGRPAGKPALFNTFREVVYVDRHGPDLHMPWPSEGGSIGGAGGTVVTVTNSDRTAYSMYYSVNGAASNAMDEIQKGEWRFAMPNLSSGTHTIRVWAFEADWGATRAIINTSTLVRTFTVSSGGTTPTISFAGINRGVGSNIELPFFRTIVSAPGATSVKLYWDGKELPLVGGASGATNVFDGRWIVGGTTQRLWGAFVNGPQFFEAVAVTGTTTNRTAVRRVFNLYGVNAIDSDGDGLPDEVEMPNFFSGTAPGPNVPWPGDNSSQGNQDMIPNYGEYWTRLNPMNADTTYSGTWDDNEDWDGDGVPNGCEVRQGYLLHTNAWHFNIYNSASKPTSCVESNGGSTIPSQASWTPSNPNQCVGSTLTVTYQPNQGPLSNSSPIRIYIGYNGFSGVTTNTMNDIGGGQWQYIYNVPGVATQINFVFTDGTLWDNNGGANWNVNVGPCVVITNFFVMDGVQDSAQYEIAFSGMKIVAAVKSNNLYVATWSANGDPNGADHFVYITDQFGAPEPSPWAKAGVVYFSKATKPHLVAESATSGGFHAFNNSGASGRSAMGAHGQVLEGEFNLAEVFGYVPEKVYIAVAAYGDNDGGGILSQCPPKFDNNQDDIEITDFLPVNIASIRDENLDGIFDGGRPYMESVVNGNTNTANYNIRRFFIDELAGDTESITFNLWINGPGGTNVISDVELFSNLNRRDFAALPGDEDWETITPSSATTYYRAYPMSGSGQGPYTVTLPVNKCGAYRVNARYKINGKRYYYTDHALRRDLAVVVTPKKALNLTMYELNPMTAEATSDQFAGRSTFRKIYQDNAGFNKLSTNYFKSLGVNMLWLQPIHPIGFDNRETDPSTGLDYDPGSPYAVRNYWKVNPVLGDPFVADGSQAMLEFQEFVAAMDANRIGVMLDGTFNHSAWDCEIGSVAVQMFPYWGVTNESDLIRAVRPQWYSKAGNYGQYASYYISAANTDIAVAPDRNDFGKWNDVADFFFGTYDALVQGQTAEWRDRYLLQEDHFYGFATNATRELWQYFAYYPIYWLEQSGHPIGTPKNESYKGIDGLRCDFAQGLPSEFWEYTINKTRSVKWDFLFMAESLDGYREINGNKRNGLSFRSARHFDIMNENMVFYWRDQYFDYKPWGGTPYTGANPATEPTWQAFDNRRNAYDVVPILLNLTGHDELLPHDDQWRLIYAYSILAAWDGVPMLFAGQEMGLQNAAYIYTNRGINAQNNYARYEVNFGKGIPQFKRYNHLTNVWADAGWKTNMWEAYKRINRARLHSPALRSQNNFMLAGTNGWNPNIFTVVKYQRAGIPAASQDVVIVAINNNYQGSTNRYDTYNVNTNVSPGVNLFGIQPNKIYNVVDLASPTPTNYLWPLPGFAGSNILNNGFTVILNGNPYDGQHVQFLKLIDTSATYPNYGASGIPDFNDWDSDKDGLPDWWEAIYGNLNPHVDTDGDGMTNWEEYLAGTNPLDANSVLEITQLGMSGSTVNVTWDAIVEKNYRVHRAGNLTGHWHQIYFGTALSTNPTVGTMSPPDTNVFYRIELKP